MTLSMDSITKIRCYAFWMWEFTRRNPEYQKAYKDFVECPGTGTPRFISIGLDRVQVPGSQVETAQQFYAKFLMFPKDPSERLGSSTKAMTPDEILDYYEQKLDNEDMRMVPGDFDEKLAPPVPTGLTVLGYNLPNIKLRYMMDGRVPQSDPTVTFALDLGKNIETTKLELEYHYYQCKLITESCSSQFDREKLFAEYLSQVDGNLPEKQREEQITEFGKRLDEWAALKSGEENARNELLAIWSKRNKVKEGTNLARAIGLWLYDNVSQQDTLYSLTQIFREKYPEVANRRWSVNAEGKSMFRIFEIYYKATMACIKKREILPITNETARNTET